MPQINISQKLNTHTRFVKESREAAAGFNKKTEFILHRAVVTSVNSYSSVNGLSSLQIGPYAITATIIGEGAYSDRPDLSNSKKWFQPLSPINNISIPEIGEEVFIIKEANSKNSMGYWVGRVNNTNQLNYYEARSWNNNETKYPFDQNIDAAAIRNAHNRNYPKSDEQLFPIPAIPGDVIQQGRAGTYIRHSIDINTSKAILEIGVNNSLVNTNINPVLPTLEPTYTKTIHAENLSLQRIAGNFQIFKKGYFESYKTKSDIKKFNEEGIIPFVLNPAEQRHSIVNIAQRHYNISTNDEDDASVSNYLYRQVLGDRNKEILEEITNILKEINKMNLDMFEFIKNHTHTIKEVQVIVGGTVSENGDWSDTYTIEEEQTKPTLENTDIYTGDTIRNIDTTIESFEDKLAEIEKNIEEVLSKTQFVQ